MNSSCSADSFFTICMRHFKRGCRAGGKDSQAPSVPPVPLKFPVSRVLPPGPSSRGQRAAALQASPSWQARKCSAASPAGSPSGRPGGSAQSGPRGPGGWRTPPPAPGRPSSVLRGPCSGRVHGGQGWVRKGTPGSPIHPPTPHYHCPTTVTEQPTLTVTSTGRTWDQGLPLELTRSERAGRAWVGRLTLCWAGDAAGREATPASTPFHSLASSDVHPAARTPVPGTHQGPCARSPF